MNLPLILAIAGTITLAVFTWNLPAILCWLSGERSRIVEPVEPCSDFEEGR